MFDSTLCMFYNYPPKFALTEMAAHLPYPEELFAATTSTECQQGACNFANTQQQPSQSLKETFALFICDDISPDAKARFVQLTPFHLFILIHSKTLQIVYQKNNTNVASTPLSPLALPPH